MLLQTSLIGSNELLELDLVLVFDGNFLGKQELALPDEVNMVGTVALPVDLLVADHVYLLHRVLQPVIEPLERPVREERKHFPEGVLDGLVLELDLLQETLVVDFHEGLHGAIYGADGRARSVIVSFTQETSLTERIAFLVRDLRHEPLGIQDGLLLLGRDLRQSFCMHDEVLDLLGREFGNLCITQLAQLNHLSFLL